METPQMLIHSPFFMETVHEPANRAILLQFILKELFQAKECLKEIEALPLFPFDFGKQEGSLNRMQEYSKLLVCAFSETPALRERAKVFSQNLRRPCPELVTLLEPFLIVCKENPYLLCFLVQHQKEFKIQAIFKKLHPQGIEKIKAIVSAHYRKKGVSLPVWTS